MNIGENTWAFTGLPGRQFTPQQAKAGMRLAVAPDRLEAAEWAKALGLTLNEAVGLIRTTTAPVEKRTTSTEVDREWELDR
ncbi:hypothetical protein H0264_14560 [Nocardia huaxiensis]|uniref:Uncharacterized protein n=1 Tax=Nocardia huaxiensis TaxID=2755382 RepID=A0A7D6VMZ1_9NOCA|nr:hypothetical protein [Nocardia huaxiensis]QLY33290.1 hypothetical protein H0264_14560 [Nocardia huaxiensis]